MKGFADLRVIINMRSKLNHRAGRAMTQRRLVAGVLAAVTFVGAANSYAAAKEVCIYAQDIDHTSIPDDHTIIFYMRRHEVWKNTLINDCVGLRINTHGFSYSPTDPGSDQLCSNLQTIRLNDTGQVCLLGAFTPVDPASAASH